MAGLWDIMTNYVAWLAIGGGGGGGGVRYSISLYSESPFAHSGYIDS